MRIGLVSQEYPPETARGGIGTQTYQKAHGLAALGHEVHVVTASRDGKDRRLRDGPVHVHRIAVPDARLELRTEAARWIAWSLEAARGLDALHAEARLDLADFPDWGAEAYVHLLNRAEWAAIPTVVQLHGPLAMFISALGWPEAGSDLAVVGTHMERTCLLRADAVYSSSAVATAWAARSYGLDPAGVPTLHSGIDLDRFQPGDRDVAAPPTIVAAMSLAPNKGARVLLAAALRLRSAHPGLRVRILGQGHPSHRSALLAEARERGAEDLLELPGFVDRARLPGELARASLFAHPSFYEAGPCFAVLEAMAAGLPVVASGGSGAAEAVVDGVTGILVPPRDDAALAAALGRLLGDPALRAAMGGRGRERAAAVADARACVTAIASFYEEILRRAVPEAREP